MAKGALESAVRSPGALRNEVHFPRSVEKDGDEASGETSEPHVPGEYAGTWPRSRQKDAGKSGQDKAQEP